MKGDFSRQTFRPERHFSSVRMQQGRVQLDADWNEQADIARHRAEALAADAVGGCGGPLHHAAFGIVRLADLPAAEQQWVHDHYPGWAEGGGDFLLSAGSYWVNGVLVENEHPVPFGRQPDVPDPSSPALPNSAAGKAYLLYLDAWDRHLTALEAPEIREVALGGPDTATRVRTVWQVKALEVPDGTTCDAPPSSYADATKASTGRMRAQARREQQSDDPCVLPAGAGYRGLENQLYRVEIHDAGPAHDPGAGGTWKVNSASPADRTVTLASAPSVAVGKPVEIYPTGPDADPMAGFVAYVADVNDKTLTLNAVFPALQTGVDYRVRALDATYKWSRDNGTVLTRIRSINGDEVVVESLGQDDVLGFGAGDWVEITDDALELAGKPGQLLQVQVPQPATRTLVLRTSPATLGATEGVDPTRNPRLRRWDGVGGVKSDGTVLWATLEDGVQVAFDQGDYHAGDHWLVPARTATSEATTGGVEWPLGTDNKPAPLRPAGITHHYCKLGVVKMAGGSPTLPYLDCRCLFAPLTEINSLSYVSGAGQEAMPDPLVAGEKVLLGQPLVVGIPNGHCQEGTSYVRFRVLGPGAGDLTKTDPALNPPPSYAATQDVAIGPDGLARCWWRLDGDHQEQQVEARLLLAGVPVQLPIVFNASLSVASEVAYDPGACTGMAGRNTVQKAIDRLAAFAHVYAVDGQAQETMPGVPLDRQLEVLVASDCGPLAGVPVTFSVARGTGSVTPPNPTTDANGRAKVTWTLDATTHYQEVVATIVDSATLKVAAPSTATFGATLSTADQVRYQPGDCGPLGGQDTVQKAIDRVVRLVGLYPAGEVSRQLLPGQEWDALEVLAASDCGPLVKAEKAVVFRTETGTFENGSTELAANTDADGVARAKWKPDAGKPFQTATATLNPEAVSTLKDPQAVVFGAWIADAGNVAYTPSEACTDLAAAGVKTVKDAIDYLCSHVGVCCEVTLSPGDDVEAKLNDMMGFSQDLDVCFRPGEYDVKQPVIFKDKRFVRITGRGAASFVRCQDFETVFRFENCDRVVIREMSLEAGTAGSKDASKQLNGTLTFRDCGEIDVEAAVLRCASGARRAAACLTATAFGKGTNYPPREMSVRVRDTEAWVGHRQIGFLVVNPDRAVVEDNVVRLSGARVGPLDRYAKDAGNYLPVFGRYVGVEVQLQLRERFPVAEVAGGLQLPQAKEPVAQPAPVVQPAAEQPAAETGAPPTVETAPVASQPAPAPVYRPQYPYTAPSGFVAADTAAAGETKPLEAAAPQQPPAELKAPAAAESVAAPSAQALEGPARFVAGDQTFVARLSKVKHYAVDAPLGAEAIEIGFEEREQVREILLGGNYSVETLDRWIRRFEAVGGQGIVVAGTRAREVRITGNSVLNFLQCIHVGVAHSDSGSDDPADSAGGVTISDNTLSVKRPYGINTQSHGVFVGNVEGLRVAGNRTTGWQAQYDESGPDADAIRVWGYLGASMHVVENHSAYCRTGVRVHPSNEQSSAYYPRRGTGLWRVAWNVTRWGTAVECSDERVQQEGNWSTY